MAEQDSKLSRWSAAVKKNVPVVRAFVVENYLPLIFAVALTVALAWPYPGKYLVDITVFPPYNIHIVQECNMILVFFISGLALRTDDLTKALKHSKGIAYGAIATLLLTPILGFVYREIPLQPREFSIGLAIFCVVPTTLGIGVALVRSCKGNEGLALILTVGTNMIAVGTMPLILKLLLLDVKGVNVSVDILRLFCQLAITVLAPSVTGKAMREFIPAVRAFATKYKVELGMLNTSSLAMIVWQNLSGARDVLFRQAAGDIIAVIVLAAAQHIFYLIANGLVIRYLITMPLPEAVAVWIMASQKSAPVHVTVTSFIAKTTSSLGLMIVPAVVGQLMQIFIGAFLARHLAPKIDAWKKAHAAPAAPAAPTAITETSPNQVTPAVVADKAALPPVDSFAEEEDVGKASKASSWEASSQSKSLEGGDSGDVAKAMAAKGPNAAGDHIV